MVATLECPEGYTGVAKTTVWGPITWRLMHVLAWNADPHDTMAVCELLRSILPCKHCRASYDHYCETTPLKCFLTSKEDMVKWSFFIHDGVNLKLEKQTVSYSSFHQRMTQCNWAITDEEVFAVLISCVYAALLEDGGAVGAAAQFPATVRRALRGSPLRAHQYLPRQVLTVPNMLRDLLDAYNTYRLAVKLPVLAKADLDAMFLAAETEAEKRDRQAMLRQKRKREFAGAEGADGAAPAKPAAPVAGAIRVTTRTPPSVIRIDRSRRSHMPALGNHPPMHSFGHIKR